jgi:hypothetical protein
MLQSKVRLGLLYRVAQSAQPTALLGQPAYSQGAPPPGGSITPDPSPPATSLYPTIRTGFNTRRSNIIDNLVKQLSVAVNTATMGQYNLLSLRDNSFQFDPSQFKSPDQKNLIVLFQKVYNSLLNHGETFQQEVNANQLHTMIQSLLQSPELNNLSTVNPTGQISQNVSTHGDFKNAIRELLISLQPTTPVRRA